MKTLFSWVTTGVLVIGLCACSKKAATTSSPESAPAVPAPVVQSESDAPAPIAAEIPIKDEGGNFPGVEMINSAIGDFVAANGRAPKDLNELVVTKYMQKVPPAPPGKKYAIDPVRRQVTLVN